MVTTTQFTEAQLLATRQRLITQVALTRRQAGVPVLSPIKLGLAREHADGLISQAIDRYRNELQVACQARSMAWPKKAWRKTVRLEGEELIIAIRPCA